MTETKGYNGYTNYETWVVNLWLDNDQGTHDYWLERAAEIYEQAEAGAAYASQTKKERALCELSDVLKSEHEEAQPEVTGVFADLLNAAMSEVDWYEIAEGFLEDFE